tara:strand:- start:5457 stop:5636 length:180 start_codon:yes stop_codon:yes gene_type:complete
VIKASQTQGRLVKAMPVFFCGFSGNKEKMNLSPFHFLFALLEALTLLRVFALAFFSCQS